MGDLAELSTGLSFAQLQESYILAGQRAYEHGSDLVRKEDLMHGVRLLQGGGIDLNRSSVCTGFGAQRRESMEIG